MNRRLMSTMGANAFGQVVTILIQFFSIPAFLSIWGPEYYGEWLVVSALPSFFSQGAGGFASASGTEMIMVRQSGDEERLVEIYHTSAMLTIVFSAVAFLLAALIALIIPQNLSDELSTTELRGLCLLFAGQISLQLIVGLLLAGFRSEAQFARGFLWQEFSRLGAFIVGMAALFLFGGAVHVAAGLLLGQSIIILMAYVDLVRMKSELAFGLSKARMSTCRRLLPPSLADAVFPIAGGVRLHGLLLIIRYFCGPVDVVVFSSLRTLSSVVFQVPRILNRAGQQELSLLYGEGNLAGFRSLYRRLFQASLVMAGLTAMGLLVFGQKIYELFVRSEVDYQSRLFLLLLLMSGLHAMWWVGATLQRSVNQHMWFARVFLASVCGTIVLACFLTSGFGLYGACVSMILLDILLLVIGVRKSLEICQDSLTDFVRSFANVPRFRSLWSSEK